MKVTIIMPAYNEEKRIGNTLGEYLPYFNSLKKRKKLDYRLLVVINGTTDKTARVVASWKKMNPSLEYLNLKRGGKGYAIIEGFKAALADKKSDLIGFVDADGATPPQAFHALVQGIGKEDGIIASRYIQGSIVRPRPSPQRILASRVYNLLIRSLFFIPYRDTQCGAKLFKRNAIEHTIKDFKMSQWAFDVDVLYHLRKNGYSIREAPTIWSDKEYSKINLASSAPGMALGIIRLRLLNSPARSFIRIYDMLIMRTYRKISR